MTNSEWIKRPCDRWEWIEEARKILSQQDDSEEKINYNHTRSYGPSDSDYLRILNLSTASTPYIWCSSRWNGDCGITVYECDEFFREVCERTVWYVDSQHQCLRRSAWWSRGGSGGKSLSMVTVETMAHSLSSTQQSLCYRYVGTRWRLFLPTPTEIDLWISPDDSNMTITEMHSLLQKACAGSNWTINPLFQSLTFNPSMQGGPEPLLVTTKPASPGVSAITSPQVITNPPTASVVVAPAIPIIPETVETLQKRFRRLFLQEDWAQKAEEEFFARSIESYLEARAKHLTEVLQRQGMTWCTVECVENVEPLEHYERLWTTVTTRCRFFLGPEKEDFQILPMKVLARLSQDGQQYLSACFETETPTPLAKNK